jgi:hypothetical protein
MISHFKISHLSAKRKKAIEDGRIVKDVMLTASESLFEGCRAKTEIILAIHELQLSAKIVT